MGLDTWKPQVSLAPKVRLSVVACAYVVTCIAQEFNIEKLQMVEAEKQKIRKEYERKESQVEVKKRMCVPRALLRAPHQRHF